MDNMKRIITLLSACALWALLHAQVSSVPSIIPQDYQGEVKIFFDAKIGSKSMVGVSDCYAHTGVITTKSTSDSDWKHAPSWLDNSAKYKLTAVEGQTDVWMLTIPSIPTYYNLSATEVVTKLAFVFRDSKGTKQTENLYCELSQPGVLTVKVSSPTDGAMLVYGTDVDVEFDVSADVTSAVVTYSDGQTTPVTFTDKRASLLLQNLPKGKCPIKIVVSDGENTAEDSIGIYMAVPTEKRKVPEGMQEGINYNQATQEVTLVFRAPHAKDVYIVGDFNDWELNEDFHCYLDSVWCQVGKATNLKDSAYHHIFWRTFTVADPTKKYGFAYKVNGNMYVSDPYATVVLDSWNDKYISPSKKVGLPAYPTDKLPDGVVSVLELEDPDPYQWEVEDFVIKDKNNLVIYELLLRDFTSNKDISGLKARLDYLVNLGVNAIEFMPVAEFDGNDSWGYNPSHYFAYDKQYGSKNMYKNIVDECHKRGIAVIVDMVFNHATGNAPMAKLYWDTSANSVYEEDPWMNRVSRHPYTAGGIDINHEYDGTREYFRRVLKYWLEEYKIDGYRMDLVKGLSQRDCGESGQKKNWDTYDKTRVAIVKDYYSAVQEANPNAVFILEHLGEYKEQKELSDAGMLPWRNMNNAYCQSAMGFASNSSFVDSNGKGGMFDNGFIGYAESHDEERNCYKANVYGASTVKGKPEVYLKRVPLNTAFVAFMPGPKMMWQFEELGYDYSINTCTDGKTIKDDCRTAAKPVPFSKGWLNDVNRMYAYEQSAKVIKLRTEHPEFFAYENVKTTNCSSTSWTKPRRIDVKYVDSDDPDNSVDIICLANFDPANSVVTNGGFSRTGSWYNYLTGEVVNIKRVDKTLTLEVGELLILTSRPLSEPVGVDESEYDGSEVTVSPTVVDDVLSVMSPAPVQNIDVLNMSGAVVRSISEEDEISMGGLTSGVYLVRVTAANVMSVHKVIKK